MVLAVLEILTRTRTGSNSPPLADQAQSLGRLVLTLIHVEVSHLRS